MAKINKRRYILAFIITAAIFSLGFFLGFIMDINRVDYFSNLNEVQKMNIRSLQLQYELIKGDSIGNKCEAFRSMFNKFITELENNRERLESYSNQANVKKEDFDMIKREYVISQINFWHISNSMKNACPGESDFVTIIYFYSDVKDCPYCKDQEIVLNYYKMKLKDNLLIFSLDEQFQEKEPLIKLLRDAYGVDSYGAIIVNNNLVYNRYVDKDELKNALCTIYQTNETKGRIC